jgi:hypothetical protein
MVTGDEVPTYWFHIGMPKCGSTSIQFGLRTSFEPHEVRSLEIDHLGDQTVTKQELDLLFDDAWENLRPGEFYEPVAIKHGRFRLLSSEDLFRIAPPSSSLGPWSGLAIVRRPNEWLLSAAFQTFVAGPVYSAHSEALGKLILNGEVETNIDCLYQALLMKQREYLGAIDAIQHWKQMSSFFELIPFSKDMPLPEIIEVSLNKMGLPCKIKQSPILRPGRSSIVLQLALSIYRVAILEYSLPLTDAFQLSRLSLVVEDKDLNNQLRRSPRSFRDNYHSLIEKADLKYDQLELSHFFGQGTQSTRYSKIEVVDDLQLLQVARLIIRSNLRRGVVSEDFDGETYLKINSDLLRASRNHDDPFVWARKHYEFHGLFENRPAPIHHQSPHQDR